MVLTTPQYVVLVGGLALVAGPYLLGRAVGAWLRWRGRSREESVGPLRAMRVLSILGLAIGASIVALATVGLVSGLWTSIPIPAVYVLLVVVTVGLTATGWTTLRRGLTPLLRDRGAGRLTVPDRLRRRRWLVVAVYPTLIVVLFSSGLLGYISPFEFAVAFAVVVVAQQWLAFAYSTPVSMSYCYFDRDPTEAERERIEACYDRFDREPPRIRVRTDMEIWPAAFVSGPGSHRTLTVSESILEEASDTALGVALAIASEQGRRNFPQRFLTAVVLPSLLGLLFALLGLLSLFVVETEVSTVAYFAPVLLCVAVLWGAGRWLRQTVFDADAFAARAFGSASVQTAYREFGSELSVYGQWRFDLPVIGPLARQRVPEPPVEVRLRRLETMRVEGSQ